MNKKMIFPYLVLLFSIVISASQSAYHSYDVIAVEPLEIYPLLYATPYPTLTPIGNTPTPISLDQAVDFTCPIGVPSGYGIVTPSTDWLYACGQCLPTFTPPAFYTSTLGPTHTPVFSTSTPFVCATGGVGTPEICYTGTPSNTATPTITFTPTSTPTSIGGVYEEISCATGDLPLDCEQLDDHTLKYTQASDITYVNAWFDGSIDTEYNLFLHVGDYVDGLGRSSIFNQAYNAAPITDVVVGNYGGSSRYSPSNYTVNFYDAYGLAKHQNILAGDYEFQLTTDHSLVVFSFQSDWGTDYAHYDDFYLIVSSAPIGITPTPTPTVTGTPLSGDGFCDAISNQNVDNQFELGGGDVVWQECTTTSEISYYSIIELLLIGPFAFLFDLDEYFASVFPVNAIVDPLTICIRSRDYSLYIFGYRMPVEAVFGLALFLSAMRFFVPTVFSGASVLGQHTPQTTESTSTSTLVGKSGKTTVTKNRTTRRRK